MAITGEMKLDSQKLVDIRTDLEQVSKEYSEMALNCGSESGGDLFLRVLEVSTAEHDYYLSSDSITGDAAQIFTSVKEMISKIIAKIDYATALIDQWEEETNKSFEELGGKNRMTLADYDAMLRGTSGATIKVSNGNGGYTSYTASEYREKLEQLINGKISSNGVGSQVSTPNGGYTNTGSNISNGGATSTVPAPNPNPNNNTNNNNTVVTPSDNNNNQENNNNSENTTNQPIENGNEKPSDNQAPVDNNNSTNNTTQVPDTSTNNNSNTGGFGQIFNNNGSNAKPNISTNIIQSNPTDTAPSNGTENIPLDSESKTENIFGDFGNVFENDNSTSQSSSNTANASSEKGFNPVPLGIGLGLATAAGIGAKVIHDRKKNNELDEEQIESFGGNKFWLDDEPSVINSEEDAFANEDLNRFDSGFEPTGYSASYSNDSVESAIPDNNTWSVEDETLSNNDQIVDLLNGN